ncbi:unnamed protein product [Clonostachys solani]|uniref:ferric-chelate reductase (NADPH) n=1 Tax=Clonostachys solani TaxID=160281 RepID=A0A9N9YXA6_9HYPO|nr:unnamed protein product [Clonostachys solani]
MALCVFLGMKNTPLGILASTSHTHINRLHRIVGYTTVFLVAIHAAFYTVHFARNGKLQSLLKVEDLAGIGAGICMLILLMGFFRNRHYEVFYASHIAGFVFALVLTALHRPDWAKKLPVVMSFIGFLWAIDRLIRASRFTYNLINNQVVMYPLPGGATRLLLRKPSSQFARPGSHCFLWIPQVSICQNHPFTIVSNDDEGLELLMKRREGFTQRVNDLALRNPGRVAWVSIDGPYGSLPDINIYDKLVLIAGGSGGAFTFGLMNYYFNCPKRTLVQSIDFIWAVKSTECGSSIKVTIYITSEESTLCDDSGPKFIPNDTQSGLHTISQHMVAPDYGTREYDRPEVLGSESTIKAITNNASIIYGKLCTTVLIHDAMRAVRSQDRVLVAACGPASLTSDLRDSVDDYESHFGSTIDIYCEDFSS